MSTANVQLEAGGLLLCKSKVDAEATEQIVARAYRHRALGERPVIRLASDRLGEAEDLAMEFLGFEAPAVSAPIAVQQRRSLSFAAWALINDPANARYALDLVKRMKAAARQARSKPGHAWDAYTEMAKDLGRSAPHFLPPFWEEAGRTFKDLGNQTYAGRALTKSLEAERVHALRADRARRRDVVLEFVLSGCLASNALSDYSADLQSQYSPQEAFAIFRDLCVRRTRGGMAPWATMPKDFTKLAKAAGLVGDAELEKWLEELIDAPAMGRPSYQFWKSCSAHCKRIVARSPAFAVALLRHTRPEARYYGESKLGPWLGLLEEWGVFPYLWEDEHRGAPPLGEPIAEWFGRIVRDELPAPARTLQLLEKLAPRLRKEGVPLPLSVTERYRRTTTIDIDVLEACLGLGIKVADPPSKFEVTFSGWLSANVDHPFRNQDVVAAAKDERFASAISAAFDEALTARGGVQERGYRQTGVEQRAFPPAAGDRPGIKELWHRHALRLTALLEQSALSSFEMALTRLESTFWPDTLRLFPDIAERLQHVDLVAMIQRTLQAGIFDEYGLPALEKLIDAHDIKIQKSYSRSTIYLTFPNIVVTDGVHAYRIGGDGNTTEHELRLPKKCELSTIVALGDDLAVAYRDDKYQGRLFWASNPREVHESNWYGFWGELTQVATPLGDGSFFLGQQAGRPGDKQVPQAQKYLHDGTRFWRLSADYDPSTYERRWKVEEVDPRTGKVLRASVPPWFEETEGGDVDWEASELLRATSGTENSPLGTKGGMLGWKAVKRRDGTYIGVGIDGRQLDSRLVDQDGSPVVPLALMHRPATKEYLPVTQGSDHEEPYWIWDPSGTTVVARLRPFDRTYARGQVTILPIHFWHLLKVRDEASSKKLRGISRDDCTTLFKAASEDRAREKAPRQGGAKEPVDNPLPSLTAAIKKFLPTAPARLALGLAHVIEHAERLGAEFAAQREKFSAEASKETSNSALVLDRNSDRAAAKWELPDVNRYGTDDSTSISTHLRDAAEFLKGRTGAGELPGTDYVWFSMLEKLPVLCWKTYWRALAEKLSQSDRRETPWLDFLKLWHELGIAELPGRFDFMEGNRKDAKKKKSSGYDDDDDDNEPRAFTIENAGDRFIVLETRSYGENKHGFQILRYSTAEKPGLPPGYEIKVNQKIEAKKDPGEIVAFIAAVEGRTAPPLPTRQELVDVAARLAVSPAEVGLVWMGGLKLDSYEHNFLPAELRTALGWKTAEANIARQALRNLDPKTLEHLCEAVVAGGCAAPFAEDRAPVLQHVEDAWRTKIPKRLPLEAALQKRLSALEQSSSWQPVEHGDLLAAASDPANHPLLQPREIRIGLEKERSYSMLQLVAKNNEPLIDGDFLRSIVQLVAVVHGETPSGHPARAEMPALIKQVSRLLDHPGTLLALRSIHLYESARKKPLKPTEWLNKHVGATKSDASTKSNAIDDGLIVGAALDGHNEVLLAFRPAKLKDEGDLARLLALVTIETGEDYEARNAAIPTVTMIKSPGFQNLAKAIVAKGVPRDKWPQDPHHTAAEVLKAIKKKRKLEEDAAALYAQLLALPDPTSANVCNWNGWTGARFKKACAELVARKLVLEASRARAGRSIFLPGEWLELKAPWLPIERWKLAHLVELDLKLPDPCPAAGPMVLRPFEDLFAAAWQRVVAGDEPRYEEVKSKARTKKKAK